MAEERRFTRQFGMLALTLVAMVIVILKLPVSERTRGQLLGLLGLAITAAEIETEAARVKKNRE